MAIKFAIRENMVPGKSLRERFENLQRLGIAGIELTATRPAHHLEEIKELTQQTGVVPCICSTHEGAILDARKPERDAYLTSLEEAIRACGDVGGVGVICVPLLPVKMQNRPRISDLSPWKTSLQLEQEFFVELMRRFAPTAESAGAAVIIEPLNRYEQWWPNRVSQGADVCKQVGSKSIRTMADFFHMNIEEPQFVDAITENIAYIAHVHLADSQRSLPGTGHTNFGPALRALLDGGYDGYYGFECSIPGDPFESLPTSMAYLRKQAGLK
jgi:sugar phosphate isomerase/epimerase